MMVANEHQTILAAGWSYRTNDRGWVIYRDPQTGQWYTRSDALAVLAKSRSIDYVIGAD
jgi:hypothetical protein